MKSKINKKYTDFSSIVLNAWVGVFIALSISPYYLLKIFGYILIVLYPFFSELMKRSWKISYTFRIWLVLAFFVNTFLVFQTNMKVASVEFKNIIICIYFIFISVLLFIWYFLLSKKINDSEFL